MQALSLSFKLEAAISQRLLWISWSQLDFDYPLAISNKHVMRQSKQRALQIAGIRVMNEIFKMPRTGVVVDSYLLRLRRLDKGDGARGTVDVAETIIERDCAASEGILKNRSRTLRIERARKDVMLSLSCPTSVIHNNT
jgi:hypothetical protein